MVYAKRPFAGPKAVLAYLSRYTHRVAISNSRLIAFDDKGVTFRRKDYRARGEAPAGQRLQIVSRLGERDEIVVMKLDLSRVRERIDQVRADGSR